MPKKRFAQVFLNILDQQLASNSPPFVRTTLARLEKEGHSPEEAKALIAGVIAHFMADLIDEDAPFDNTEYQHLLDQLPNLPGL